VRGKGREERRLVHRWFGAFGKPSQAIQAMYMLNGLPE